MWFPATSPCRPVRKRPVSDAEEELLAPLTRHIERYDCGAGIHPERAPPEMMCDVDPTTLILSLTHHPPCVLLSAGGRLSAHEEQENAVQRSFEEAQRDRAEHKHADTHIQRQEDCAQRLSHR